MNLDPVEARRRAGSADHGVLATLRADGRGIDLVPAVFAIEGDHLAIPIDRVKPKREGGLQRVRNLDANPEATFLVERWARDDWSRLWWVRLRLRRVTLDAGKQERLGARLRARYPQYATATPEASFDGLLTFEIGEVSGWSAD